MDAKTRTSLKLLTLTERAAKIDGQAEKELQRLCEQALNSRGIVYLHLSPMAREKIGWPDLVFCVCGKPYAVELKTLKGKLTVDQSRMMIRMEGNGWHTHIIRSYDAFRELLDGREYDKAKKKTSR